MPTFASPLAIHLVVAAAAQRRRRRRRGGAPRSAPPGDGRRRFVFAVVDICQTAAFRLPPLLSAFCRRRHRRRSPFPPTAAHSDGRERREAQRRHLRFFWAVDVVLVMLLVMWSMVLMQLV